MANAWNLPIFMSNGKFWVNPNETLLVIIAFENQSIQLQD